MVKIRLMRMGAKGRPFYRIVVAKSTAARNGTFVEVLGTYDPISQPKVVKLDSERALHWLTVGAQPTETVAYLLKKDGVLDRYFDSRPAARAKFKSLDKRTDAMSKKSAVSVAAPAPVEEAPAPVEQAVVEVSPVEEPVVEAVAEAPVEEAAADPAPAEEPVVEEAPVEEAPVEETPAVEPPAEAPAEEPAEETS